MHIEWAMLQVGLQLTPVLASQLVLAAKTSCLERTSQHGVKTSSTWCCVWLRTVFDWASMKSEILSLKRRAYGEFAPLKPKHHSWSSWQVNRGQFGQDARKSSGLKDMVRLNASARSASAWQTIRRSWHFLSGKLMLRAQRCRNKIPKIHGQSGANQALVCGGQMEAVSIPGTFKEHSVQKLVSWNGSQFWISWIRQNLSLFPWYKHELYLSLSLQHLPISPVPVMLVKLTRKGGV